jgi:hypothetical protein
VFAGNARRRNPRVKGAAVAEQHLPRWSAVHEDNRGFLRQRKIRGIEYLSI